MIKNSNSLANIKCEGEHATVHFEDGSSQQVAQDVLRRSGIFCQALRDSDLDVDSRLAVPEDILRSWLQWIQIDADVFRGSIGRLSAALNRSYATEAIENKLVKFLQAADFLDDQEALTKLCKLSAERFIPRRSGIKSPVPDLHSHSVEALKALPETLQIRVLAEAQESCIELISMLPPELHMGALHAKYPSIAAHGTIKVARSDMCLCADHWMTFWDLVTKFSHIEHLVLAKEDISPCASLKLPVRAFKGLKSLTLEGINADLGFPPAPVFEWASRWLTSLQHLEVRSKIMSGKALDNLIALLHNASSLQRVHMHSEWIADGSRFQEIIRRLQRLPCLQHLDLGESAKFPVVEAPVALYLSPLSNLTSLKLPEVLSGSIKAPLVDEWQLKALPRLKHLRCSLSCSRGDPPIGLRKLTCLEHLHIRCSSNSINRSLLRVTSCSLPFLQRLTTLELTDYLLDENTVTMLGTGLSKLSELQVLSLTRASLPRLAVLGLLQALSPLPVLHSLSLEWVYDFTKGPSLRALAALLRLLPHPLQHLSLSHNGNVPEFLPPLAGSFTTLTSLELQRVKLDMPRATDLSKFLLSNPGLRKLHLTLSHTLSSFIRTLAPSIGCLTALEDLNLSDNNLRCRAIMNLTPHLAKLPSLQILNLAHSPDLGDVIGVLCMHLSNLTGLKRLVISHCRVMKKELHGLAVLMGSHQTIEHLDIWDDTTPYAREWLVTEGFEDIDRRVLYKPLLNEEVSEERERSAGRGQRGEGGVSVDKCDGTCLGQPAPVNHTGASAHSSSSQRARKSAALTVAASLPAPVPTSQAGSPKADEQQPLTPHAPLTPSSLFNPGASESPAMEQEQPSAAGMDAASAGPSAQASPTSEPAHAASCSAKALSSESSCAGKARAATYAGGQGAVRVKQFMSLLLLVVSLLTAPLLPLLSCLMAISCLINLRFANTDS